MSVLELQELKKEILTNLTFQEHRQLYQTEQLEFMEKHRLEKLIYW